MSNELKIEIVIAATINRKLMLAESKTKTEQGGQQLMRLEQTDTRDFLEFLMWLGSV